MFYKYQIITLFFSSLRLVHTVYVSVLCICCILLYAYDCFGWWIRQYFFVQSPAVQSCCESLTKIQIQFSNTHFPYTGNTYWFEHFKVRTCDVIIMIWSNMEMKWICHVRNQIQSEYFCESHMIWYICSVFLTNASILSRYKLRLIQFSISMCQSKKTITIIHSTDISILGFDLKSLKSYFDFDESH